MIATKNKNGLYEFDITVHGKKKNQTLKGLIDTGSTDCACTYKVITTLQIRPIDFIKVNAVISQAKCFVYDTSFAFDAHVERMSIIRVPEIADGAHLIIGMSVLEKCTINYDGDQMEIKWRIQDPPQAPQA